MKIQRRFHLEIGRGSSKGREKGSRCGAGGGVFDLDAVYRDLVARPEFVDVVRARVKVTLTTTELEIANSKLTQISAAILAMSDEILKTLVDEVLGHVASLYILAEIVSILDVMQSFALASARGGWRPPTLSSGGGDLVLQDAVHPILGAVFADSDLRLVPNNVFASDEHNFVLVSGSNMSGKSTYLRMIALIQILGGFR